MSKKFKCISPIETTSNKQNQMNLVVALNLTCPEDIISWVQKIIKRHFYHQTISYQEELISIGLLELAKIAVLIDSSSLNTFKKYAYLRVRGAAIDFSRRESRLLRQLNNYQTFDDIDLFSSANSALHPEQQLLHLEFHKVVRNAIKRLPEDKQSIIYYHFYSEFSLSEMATWSKFKSVSWLSKQKTQILNQLYNIDNVKEAYFNY